MTVTEESLECTECNWAGTEAEAVESETEYECPVCGGQCAHFPLDELGSTIETFISHGWNMRLALLPGAVETEKEVK